MAVGFVVEKEWRATCHYTLDDRSMMRTQYQAVFFQARKPLTAGDAEAASNRAPASPGAPSVQLAKPAQSKKHGGKKGRKKKK